MTMADISFTETGETKQTAEYSLNPSAIDRSGTVRAGRVNA